MKHFYQLGLRVGRYFSGVVVGVVGIFVVEAVQAPENKKSAGGT